MYVLFAAGTLNDKVQLTVYVPQFDVSHDYEWKTGTQMARTWAVWRHCSMLQCLPDKVRKAKKVSRRGCCKGQTVLSVKTARFWNTLQKNLVSLGKSEVKRKALRGVEPLPPPPKRIRFKYPKISHYTTVCKFEDGRSEEPCRRYGQSGPFPRHEDLGEQGYGSTHS